MSAPITEDDVINALRQNPEFTRASDNYNLEVIRPVIPKLIECVERVGSDTPVTVYSISEVIVSFIQVLLEGSYLMDLDEEFRYRHGFTPEYLREKNIRVAPNARALERLQQAYQNFQTRHDRRMEEEQAERDYLLSEAVGLTPIARRLYESGTLTLGTLLRVQPDRLLPDWYILFPWNENLPR